MNNFLLHNYKVSFFLHVSVAVIILFCLFSCSSNQATIGIDPGETFILGELEESSFKAKVTNLSKEELNIKVTNTKSGEQTQAFGLDGKGNAEIYVSASETAQLINNSGVKISVKAVLNKSVEGMRYVENPIIQARILKKDSLISDLILLEKALTELHPGLYRYNQPDDIKNAFNELKVSLPYQIKETDLIKELAQLLAKIRCGHTYINPWNMDADLRKRLYGSQQFFPIGFQIVDGRFIVTENAIKDSGLNRGAELFEINNIPVSEIYSELSKIAKYDGNNAYPTDLYLSLQNYTARHWNAFDIYFPLFYPLTSTLYSIKYRNHDSNVIQEAKVDAMHKEEREKKMAEIYGKEILENKKWSLDIVNEDLAVMKLGTFATWNWKDFNHEEWFNDAFAQLDSLGINNLAIDLRGNGGGLSEPMNDLISYLIDEPIKCKDLGKVLIRTTKLDPSLLPYTETWAKPLIAGLPQEYYKTYNETLYELLEPSECVDINPKEKGYNGKVYMYGGPSNVSATFTLLKRAKEFDFATYIGEPSGGNKQGINGGEYAFFTMPYSKVEVDIPLKYFAPTMDEKDEGLNPDETVKTTPQDIATDNDPYLQYVKSKN